MIVRSRTERKTARRKIRWPRLFLVLFVLLVIVMTITAAATYAYFTLSGTSVVSGGASATKTTDTINNRINILILGLDDGDVNQASAPNDPTRLSWRASILRTERSICCLYQRIPGWRFLAGKTLINSPTPTPMADRSLPNAPSNNSWTFLSITISRPTGRDS